MSLKQIPKAVADNAQFARYWDILQMNPASIVFVPMAELLREAGCLEEARDVCEQGLRHNADSISGRLLLASVYLALGRAGEAEHLAREVRARMPGHPEAARYIKSQPAVPPLYPAGRAQWARMSSCR